MCWQKCKQHQVVERVASVKHHSPAKLICNFSDMADFHRHILIFLFTLELWRVPTSALSALSRTGKLTAIIFKDEARSDRLLWVHILVCNSEA